MIVQTFARLRKLPMPAKQRLVALASFVVMVIVTIVWLPLFFLNARYELSKNAQQPESTAQTDDGLKPPYAQ